MIFDLENTTATRLFALFGMMLFWAVVQRVTNTARSSVDAARHPTVTMSE